jgi:hypothetical protein
MYIIVHFNLPGWPIVLELERQQLNGTPHRSTDGLSIGLVVQLKYSFFDQSLKDIKLCKTRHSVS